MIGAVVVLYNPTKEEIENINTYINQVSFMVIMDNSDNDNSLLVQKLLFNYPHYKYYSQQKNLGLCNALNIGVQILKEQGCDWALLFDADSKLGSDVLAVYKEAIRKFGKEPIALFSPVHMFDRSKNHPYKGYKELDWTMTSGCLFDIEIFIKQNGFFDELFVDGLDMDYCFKSNENGYKVIECGAAVIKHNPAETKSLFGFKYGVASPFRYYMQARQLIWCWKRYKRNKVFEIYLYKWFKVVFIFPNKREYIQEMMKGTRDGLELLRRYSYNEK